MIIGGLAGGSHGNASPFKFGVMWDSWSWQAGFIDHGSSALPPLTVMYVCARCVDIFLSFFCSDIVTNGFYIARTGLGAFGEGWEEKGEDVDWFLYNRLWAVGVFSLIEDIGLEPTEEVRVSTIGVCCLLHWACLLFCTKCRFFLRLGARSCVKHSSDR